MSKSTKTTQENKPPAWATPLFTKSAEDALNLYNSGSGGRTYTGSTVTPLSGTTMAGVNQLANAGANWDTGQTRGLFGGLGAAAVSNPYVNQLGGVANDAGNTRNVGVSAYTNAAGQTANQIGNQGQSIFNPIATGQQGITTGNQWQDLYNKGGQKSASETNLAGMASGEYLKSGNPHFNARLEGQLADTAAQTRSLMSGSGRYGSDVSNRVLADRLGGIRTEALAQDWDRNLAAMMGANSQIDAARNAGFGNQATALSGLTGVQGQNIQNRMTAGNNLVNALGMEGNLQRGVGQDIAGIMTGNADRALAGTALQGNLLSQAGNMYGQGIDRGLTATNAMAGLDQRNFENRLAGADATLKAGGIVDNQSNRLLQDEIAKFYALDNEDWTRLGMLQSAASGAAGPYGTQVASSRQPIGLGSLLGGAGQMFSGLGAMGKSDVRAKENIALIGEANGIPIYEFSYKNDDARWIGTMAQALPMSKWDALYIDPADGLYGVNYAALGLYMTRVH